MRPSFDKSSLQLKEHLQGLEQSLAQDLLHMQAANDWLRAASLRPTPRQLFSELWLEGELCILFADTNVGKSVLAVQLADSISRGVPIRGFVLEAEAQPVLYVDFELSDKQFEMRYSVASQDHYTFSDHFFRAELAPEADLGTGSVEAQLHGALERALLRSGAKVLIIDNITYLSEETEKAQYALPLMKQLKALQRKHHLSIMTLAHTPKRDMSRPLTRNDLQGSKMLINFCDTAFAIGESQQERDVRYLKQLKARSTELKYHSDHVSVCRLSKPGNFVGFEWLKYGAEIEHLQRLPEEIQASRMREAMDLKAEGLSNVEIAKQFGVSEAAIRRWAKKLQQ